MRQFGYNEQETSLLNRLKVLQDPLAKVLFTHVLNVVVQGVKCGYMGKPYSEEGDLSERCLVPEIRNAECPCPFYAPLLPGKCDYPHNR